ncbi:MAG: hypothetical protein EBR01_03305 [Proteobacteria bacterium]|nr:hypothetical protein [Pseudomonadota bacterium]
MSGSEKKSLIVAGDYCSIINKKFFHGMSVPWEVKGYELDFEVSESVGGIFDLSFYGIVEVQGKDAQDYLQRMTTVQFKSLGTQSVAHGAFLNGRGGVVVLGMFRRLGPDAFQIFVLNDLKQKLMEHIEQFHFAESFAVRDLSEDLTVMGCWSRDGQLASSLGISAELKSLELQSLETLGPEGVVWRDVRRSSLYWMIVKRPLASTFIQNCIKNGHFILGLHLYEYFRIQSGMPDPGEELSEKDIILEGNFEEAVARNKGCYPGQEVVERIFTYGQVNRKLLRVEGISDSGELFSLPQIIKQGEKEVGTVVACEKSPTNDTAAVGLMYVRKDFWNSKESWAVPPNWRISLA